MTNRTGRDRMYSIWHGMKQRCDYKKHANYHRYGAKGITYDERWSKFKHFYEDMIEGYSDDKTIDRIDSDKGYSVDNCRWATYTEQMRNKKNNTYVLYEGEQRLLIELCEEFNLDRGTVAKRIFALGWSVEKALTTPVRPKRKQ